MKLSVSLSEDDVKVLDDYVVQHGLGSRSAALQAAVRALHHEALVQDYVEEFPERHRSEDKQLWDSVSDSGLDRDAAW